MLLGRALGEALGNLLDEVLGGLFFFPREKVPSAFTVPPVTKFWLFFSYEGKSSLGAQNLKTLIPKLSFKAQYIPTVTLGKVLRPSLSDEREKVPSEKI